MVVRKMKEKCKDAARMRREKERAEFVELSKLLPLPSSTTSQLDKASIIRLTSSYLRMRSAFPEGLGGDWGNDRLSSSNRLLHGQAQSSAERAMQYSRSTTGQPQQQQVRELGSLILQTLDGFVFALHKDGKIMYISETASVHLGLPQIDLTGSSVFDYAHPADHNDIYEMLSLSEHDKAQLKSSGRTTSTELSRSFCMRMKCILPKRNAGLVSSGYKAIHCNGYLKVKCKAQGTLTASGAGGHSSVYGGAEEGTTTTTEPSSSNSISGQESGWEGYALVAVGHSLLPTASTEVKLTGNSFLFRASLDLKLYYIEAPVMKLLGFEQIEMIGQSLYQFVHINDISGLENSHRSLLEKGQVVTKYYRLMKKDGGSVWIQSYATLVNNPRNMPKPQHIVNICFVLGENQLDQSGVYHERRQQQQYYEEHQDHQQKQQATVCIGAVAGTDQGVKGSVVSHGGDSLGGPSIIQRTVSHQKTFQRKEKHPLTLKKSRKIKSIGSLSGSGSTTKPSTLIQNPDHDHKNGDNYITASNYQTHYHNVHNQSSCVQPTNNKNSTITRLPGFQHLTSIGSTRRPSDDSCSVVSSIASTSVSSSCGSLSHQTSPEFLGGYTPTGGGDSYASTHSDHLLPALIYPTAPPADISSPSSSSSSLLSIKQPPAASMVMEPRLSANCLYSRDCFVGLVHHHCNHNHQQQQQPPAANTAVNVIQRPAVLAPATPDICWLTPNPGILVDGEELARSRHNNHLNQTNSMDTEQVVSPFNNHQPTTCNVTPHYFQSSPDWLLQSPTDHIILGQKHHTSTAGVYHHQYTGELIERRTSSYCSDTTSISSHYHESPPYMGNGETHTIYYQQQVTVNNGYTM